MAEYIFKMPDIGEGIVDAEIVEWHVKPGEMIDEDGLLAAVMTDKATVDITSPVAGQVTRVGGAVGDKIAIGAEFVIFALDSETETETETDNSTGTESDPVSLPDSLPNSGPDTAPAFTPSAVELEKPSTPDASSPLRTPVATMTDSTMPTRKLASPAVRRRARELGLSLNSIQGSGPKGRVLLKDLLRSSTADVSTTSAVAVSAEQHAGDIPEVTDIPVTGLRRIIARRMQAAKRNIPHFTYVEEVDVTELEQLRAHMNSQRSADQPKLSPLPFFIIGVCRAVSGWPQCNAHYDAEAEVLSRFRDVHIGVATMTDAGLMVPVIRAAQRLSLWDIAREVNRLARAAREQSLSRDELSGSTITISSLGPLAGVAATPILNAPETCIIGPNRIREKLVLQQGAVVSRQVLNLSSSFDHRVVDGYDAAGLIQKIKQLLEHPATLFVDLDG